MILLLALLGCSETEGIPLHFEGPSAAAVLAPDDGPFRRPVGLVANLRSGRIVPVDLASERLLADDPIASFVRATPLATGTARLLQDLVVVGDRARVTAWAVDSARGVALSVPWIEAVDGDGHPTEGVASADPVVVEDLDGNGVVPTVTQVSVTPGRTTTETWTFTRIDGRWTAMGSRSQPEPAGPVVGVPWRSAGGELGLLLTADGSDGDRFVVDTRAGVEEYVARAHALLAVDRTVLVAVDGAVEVRDGLDGTSLGTVALPTGARPGRMSVAPDGRVFVADTAQGIVWVLRFDVDADPATVPVDALATASPVVDLAWQGGDDALGAPFSHLFVVPLGLRRVDVYDLLAGAWRDPNPVGAGAEGVDLLAPVTGLSATPGPVTLPSSDAWGAHPRVPTVVVALADGRVVQLDGSTGCAVTTARGPHGPNPSRDSGSEYVTLRDQGAASDAALVIDSETGEQVVASPCGGVTRGETWTVRWDSATLDWAVEGTRSGVQRLRAHSGERYLSDDGAVSFLLDEGARPPTDGDRFVFATDPGLQVFRCSDVDGDSLCGASDTTWDFPGRPAAFVLGELTPTGGWTPAEALPYALLPVTNGDLATRLRLELGDADVTWR